MGIASIYSHINLAAMLRTPTVSNTRHQRQPTVTFLRGRSISVSEIPSIMIICEKQWGGRPLTATPFVPAVPRPYQGRYAPPHNPRYSEAKRLRRLVCERTLSCNRTPEWNDTAFANAHCRVIALLGMILQQRRASSITMRTPPAKGRLENSSAPHVSPMFSTGHLCILRVFGTINTSYHISCALGRTQGGRNISASLHIPYLEYWILIGARATHGTKKTR